VIPGGRQAEKARQVRRSVWVRLEDDAVAIATSDINTADRFDVLLQAAVGIAKVANDTEGLKDLLRIFWRLHRPP
jgi:hypothetical protein